MSNQITASGIQTKTYDELYTELSGKLRTVYGEDINIDPDSPDGQMIAIFVQAALDNLDLLTQIYNSFDPDHAMGRTLDERCSINGIVRLGGTFTITNVTVSTDRALTLSGLDADIDNPDGTGYTVQDNSGNKFILASTANVSGPGDHVLQFRAKNPGALETTPNSITVPVSVVLGVTAVNNPTTYSTKGINEETDSQLRIRRQRSVALSSKGYLQGLLAALLNINGVTAAFVYENSTGATDADGIPEHAIWAIVDGGLDADIAKAIYQKRNAGCSMKGAHAVNIIQVDGSVFQILFDRVATEDLYMRFNVTSISGDPINVDSIKAGLVSGLHMEVYETMNINKIGTVVQSIDSNALVTSAGLSLSGAGPWTNILTNSAKNKRFSLSADNISITVV